MNEIWKDIPGYEYYQASNLGNVRSLDRFVTYKSGPTHLHKGRVLIVSLHHMGYMVVGINGKSKRGHRLVAMAFLPTIEGKPLVNHKDAVKTNNRVDNLEWCNRKENEDHAKLLGLKGTVGDKHGNSKLKEAQVMNIRNIWDAGGITQTELAYKYNVSIATISMLLSGKNWKRSNIKREVSKIK